MMNAKTVVAVAYMTLALSLRCVARADEKPDTLRSTDMQEVYVTASPKETVRLRFQPLSMSVVDKDALVSHSVQTIKDLGALVPNMFIPDYGSRQTSAIYIRGVGSRIGTPAVGLYVDNLPYYDKAAYDFTLHDIESIEVLRGPQNTLYGRNTMGGLVKVNTKSPFSYTGTDIRLGYSTGDNRRHATVTHYHRISDKTAFSAGVFYNGSSGFFDNDITGKRMDGSETGGARLRAIFKPTRRLTLDASVHYEYTDEGAFPYYYTGSTDGDEEYADLKGKISANVDGKYHRSLLTAGVHTTYDMGNMSLYSVTAYQNISDNMLMDQDFINADIYTLRQRQLSNIVSEELTLKGKRKGLAQGLLGVNFFYEWQDTKAPVTFRKDGVTWLNNTINANANKYLPEVQSGPMKMSFLFSDNIQGEELAFNDSFSTPTLGASLFQQTTFHDLFGVDNLSANIGVRLDYERLWMDYSAWYAFKHVYGLKGMLTMPSMQREVEMVKAQEYQVSDNSLAGANANDYLQLLPKIAVQYTFTRGKVYASVSRGFRSGGYNVQNISELMRLGMQTGMMKDVRDATVPVLQAQPAIPEETKQSITGVLNTMAAETPLDVEGACLYSPEYAWNYEAGTRLYLADKTVTLDATAFWSDVHDLQLSKMSETGLGRVTVNAGRSRSVGVEAAITAKPVDGLLLNATYGYTHSTFRKYETTDDNGASVDYKGKYIPYMPMQTFSADAAYTFSMRNKVAHAIAVGVGCNGAGRIYWNESNSYSQPLYALLSARVGFAFKYFDITVWGKNLTDTRYNTFWFDSMQRGYEQHGAPLQVGFEMSLRL